jgi:hypothetical protein
MSEPLTHVVIDRSAKARLWAFIKAVKVEVGGMGYAFKQDDGSLLWRDAFLIPQEVSSSEVDFEKTGGDQRAIERAVEDGVLDDPRFVWVSWHSHHTMKAFWSGTDDSRIAAMSKVGITRMLSFVGTHSGEYEMRFDLFGVEEHDVRVGQVTIGSVRFEAEAAREPSDFEKSIAAEIEENVTEKKFWTGTPTYTNGKRDKDDGSYETKSSKKSSLENEFLDSAAELRRVTQELVSVTGSTKVEAEDLVNELGLDQAEDLLWDYYRGLAAE